MNAREVPHSNQCENKTRFGALCNEEHEADSRGPVGFAVPQTPSNALTNKWHKQYRALCPLPGHKVRCTQGNDGKAKRKSGSRSRLVSPQAHPPPFARSAERL